MKKFTTIAIVIASSMLSPTVIAHAGEEHGVGQKQNMPQYGNGYGKMMTDADFDQMQEHMEEMQSLMGKLFKEQDPEKHQQLMQEHMRLMQKNMQMMNGGMGMMNQGQGMMGNGDRKNHMMNGNQEMMGSSSSGQAPDSSLRLHRLEERISLMQQMMQQLMNRESEQDRLSPKK